MLSTTIRTIIAVVAVLMLLGGVTLIAIGGSAAPSGLWAVVLGAGALVVLAIERNRYRSEAAEQGPEPVGPGGGEPVGAMEPRFRPTDESFVDPTTGHRMRVFVDPRSGERRYMAEG
jgi:hypothetical protein